MTEDNLNPEHVAYICLQFDIAETVKHKIDEKMDETFGEDSWFGDAMASVAGFSFDVVSKAKAAVSEPNMEIGSKLGHKIADAAKKKGATLHVYELLQIHKDNIVDLVYKIQVVYIDAELIVNAKTAHRKRMPNCLKKCIAYRIQKRVDLDKLAAEKILEKVPQKAAVKLNENGVTGHVYAFKDLDGVKNCLIEKFDVEEDKVVFADPGILYEGVGEDVGSPISNKHMDGKDKAELPKLSADESKAERA